MNKKQVYQYITKINYEFEVWAFEHNISGKVYKTFDPLNVSKNDDMLSAMIAGVSGGDVVYDIGANIGNYSFAAAILGAESHAFEPDPTMFNYLQKNVNLNDGISVSPHQIAVADTDTEATFYQSHYRGAGSLTKKKAEGGGGLKDSVEVPVRKLTTLSTQISTPDLIKIDAEGQLIEIVEGAKEVLLNHRPVLFFEPHTSHDGVKYSKTDYVGILKNHGYEIEERGRFVDARPVEDD